MPEPNNATLSLRILPAALAVAERTKNHRLIHHLNSVAARSDIAAYYRSLLTPSQASWVPIDRVVDEVVRMGAVALLRCENQSLTDDEVAELLTMLDVPDWHYGAKLNAFARVHFATRPASNRQHGDSRPE